jgi:hypothetical protein
MIQNLLLAIIVLLFTVFYWQLKEAYYDKTKLIQYSGTVQKKMLLKEERYDKEPLPVLLLTMDNRIQYRISRFVNHADHYFRIGDSATVFTKPSVRYFSNYVTSEDGFSFSSTNHLYEVYELVSLSDGVVIIDFEKNKSNLKKMIWISPLCAVVLMAWVLYRRDRMRRGIVDEDMFGG